ncbi:MAG: branched-chain amino acid ABC transporter permease, partial [Rhodocyclales bacterium]|nr:branched-chain amino acid ABC transporter permease [Rhodocyclales bacterium]
MGLLFLPLPARPPGAGAADLRPDPRLRRAAQHHLRQRRAWRADPGVLHRLHRADRDPELSDLPHRRLGGLPAGGGRALLPDPLHAARHDDPRRQPRSRHGAGARHQHRPALPRRFRARLHAGGVLGNDFGPALVGGAGHGQPGADHFLRRRRHRRHRLRRRRHGGGDGDRLRRRFRQGAGAGIRRHVRLSGHGCGTAVAARRHFQERLNLQYLQRFHWVPLAALLLALLLFPIVGQEFYIELVAKTMILAIFAMSLQLLVGHTGLVSFGHAAYFGIAAYTLALAMPKYEAASVWWLMPLAVAAAALAALLIGLFVLRTRGIYFIMVTLAFAQMAFFLFHDTSIGGGSDGIYVNFKPTTAVFGWQPFDLENA